MSRQCICHKVRRPSIDIQVNFLDRPRGTPTSGELNTRGVAEYSDLTNQSSDITINH